MFYRSLVDPTTDSTHPDMEGRKLKKVQLCPVYSMKICICRFSGGRNSGNTTYTGFPPLRKYSIYRFSTIRNSRNSAYPGFPLFRTPVICRFLTFRYSGKPVILAHSSQLILYPNVSIFPYGDIESSAPFFHTRHTS